jgi:hypothetical protein
VEKHHSCLNTGALIEYFEERLPAAVPALWEGLGPEIAALPDPREFLMEINNWVSSEVVIRMFDNARRLTGREDIAFEIGFQSAARKKLGYSLQGLQARHRINLRQPPPPRPEGPVGKGKWPESACNPEDGG